MSEGEGSHVTAGDHVWAAGLLVGILSNTSVVVLLLHLAPGFLSKGHS